MKICLTQCRIVAVSIAVMISTFMPPTGLAQPPADLELLTLASGLSQPVGTRHAGDGSGRIFIIEQGGRIRVFDGAAILPTPFLDITSLVISGGEQGLLGLAFHPNYESNGLFYVNYTRNSMPVGDTIVARYTVSGADPNVADPASALVLLEQTQPASNHNGGDMHFGPDGFLYIGMGDGGGFDTPQALDTLLGKMLRIDVDGGVPYAIPADNPFVGVVGAREEIWALGLRNPWRWSFDRLTGDLLLGDVGEGSWEEVDFQPASSSGGENYGWPCREGAHDFLPMECDAGAVLTDPVLEFSHGSGACSVIGGYVYRGSIPSLRGYYVYSDWCTGEVWWAVQTSPGVWSETLWDTVPGFNLVGYGEDEVGEVYAAFGEDLVRFHSPSASGAIFADDFESGDATAWSAASP